MIRFENVSVTYDGADAPALAGADFTIPAGELCLVVGPTGVGKSTLLNAVNGHVPHFTGGRLTGRVLVAGRDTRTHRPRDLADVVGVVPQDPAAGFVTDVVEDEIAYGMESLGTPPDVMRRRVEESLDLLGLADLRGRALRTLSGGQRQRVAIASVLAAHPQVLVLDEPTSALDPAAAEEVLAALQRLVHDLGLTVLLSEHRLERVAQFADQVVLLSGPGVPPRIGDPAALLADSPVAPPVVELARLAGWHPVPLSVRDARRRRDDLLVRLPHHAPAPPRRPATTTETLVSADRLVVGYGQRPVLTGVTLAAAAGEVVAVMGRNGAGKSTLLHTLVGMLAPERGSVRVAGADPARLRGVELIRRVGFVPADPGRLLWAETVAAECVDADKDADLAAGTTAALLAELDPELPADAHPRDLSEGQRLTVALAVVLAAEPSVLLLDEPTRGLDYVAKHRLVGAIRSAAADGRAIVLSTHDVELVADVADRVIVLADGEVVTDGPAAAVVLESPAYAPQVAKVLAPGPWLTVADVAAALEPAS